MAEDEINDTSATGTPSKKKTTKVKKSPVRKKIPATRATRTTSADNAPSSLKSEPASVDRDTGNNPAPERPVTRPGSRGQAVVSWIALILSAVAVCAGGYAWYLGTVDSKSNAVQQETRLDLIERRIGGVEQTQTGLSTGISQLGDSLARFDADTDELIKDVRNEISNQDNSVRELIQNEIDALSNQVVTLRSQLSSSADEWILEEAEQLILIADQRLRFSGEAVLAKQALQLADQQLAQLSGSGVNEVRRLLSTDIAEINNLPSIDMPGILNELSVLSDKVDKLPLAGDIVVGNTSTGSDADRGQGGESQGVEAEAQGSDSQGDVAESGTLERFLKPVMDAGATLLTNLGDLVQVEKNDNPVKPLISAQERRMTYEKTRLILESAQIALVREKPQLFTNRINAAGEWVKQNFNRDVARTRDWIERLDRVGSSFPDTEIPDISATLSAIRALGRSEPGGQQE